MGSSHLRRFDIRIFYWCNGQDDNIGDVILRRRLLWRLQQLSSIDTYVSDATVGFVEALGVRHVDRQYRGFSYFVASLTKSALVGQAPMFVFNPGEIRCNAKQSLMHVMLLPALVLIRVRGGATVRAGVGSRDWHWFWGRLVRATARLADVNYWRDDVTRGYFGIGDVAPDWAFDLGPLADGPTATPGGERTLMAVSLRSDRPDPSDEWCTAMRTAADELSLRIVVVTQVRRDEASGERLARRLTASVTEWADHSHAEQERRARDVYRQARVTVSDRLHCLALGAVEGSVPVSPSEGPDVKIGRHFRAAGVHGVSADVRGWDATRVAGFVTDTAARSEEISKDLVGAQLRLRAIDAEIASLAARKGRPRA